MDDVKDHYNAVADTYYRQYQRENLKSVESYPANYFRLQILVQRMSQAGVKSVYEVGVGEGTPLATMASLGLKVAGCDIAETMVQKARETFRSHGLSPDLIQWGDIQDATTIAAQLQHGLFDAVMALGVLPHVRNDNTMLQNLSMMLPKGGKIFVEFRNFMTCDEYAAALAERGLATTYRETVGRTYRQGEEYFEYAVVAAVKEG